MEKLHVIRPISKKPRERFPRPAIPLAYGFDGRCYKGDTLEYSEIALSSFNEKNRAQRGPEYELVEALDCIQFPFVCIYHCNFIARPKFESEAENKLFFAEVKYEENPGKDGGGLYCHFWQILGPSGSKTGLGGCDGCKDHPGLIQHPEEGFTKFDNVEQQRIMATRCNTLIAK